MADGLSPNNIAPDSNRSLISPADSEIYLINEFPIPMASPERRNAAVFRGSVQRVSRSHYSSRSADSDSVSELPSSFSTRSAAEVRQQTLSFTFRDLSMSQPTQRFDSVPQLIREDLPSPAIQAPKQPSKLALAQSADSDGSESSDVVSALDIKKNPIPSPSLSGDSNISVPRARNVSQLSALRNAMSSNHTSPSSTGSRTPVPSKKENHTGNSDTNKYQNKPLNTIPDITVATSTHVESLRHRNKDSDLEFNETTPLLGREVSNGHIRFQSTVSHSNSSSGSYKSKSKFPASLFRDLPPITSDLVLDIAKSGLKSIPAVLLGVILNVLDAMSYGIIVFPQSDELMPSSAAQSGISMFFASTVISQLVYTFGGSKFKGANGSMMIEVMPFLHIMCRIIENQIGNGNQRAIMATIMVTFALSTLLTGLVFLLLGIFKLGNVIQFFPRHILVGCIGGIGLFLIETGIEVSTGIKTEFNFEYVEKIFQWDKLQLWGSGFALAVFLKFLQKYITHPLFIPSFYVVVPLFFYAVVWAIGISLADLRKSGWLFDLPSSSEVPFYTFWTYFDFTHTVWGAIPATLPTMLALTFFGILHVPINVPALAVSTHQEVDTNLEIVGHGISNIAAGLIGTVQNYLVYANSLLYIRSGGNTRIGGFLLAVATAVIWVLGGSVVSLVPTMVVGSLIFLLGIDLMKESIVDTLHVGIHKLEYLTILIIIAIMGVFGFTEGIIAGIVLACFFFVVIYSRKSVIRTSYSGTNLRSTVHRLYRQQRFLDQCGNQIQIIKLQGFMFFGTINQLDVTIKELLDKHDKIRFIILDFSLISGIDYSAVEAFLRIKRNLRDQNTHMVFSGLGEVLADLVKSGIFENDKSGEEYVHNFSDLNEALEWCENILLAVYFRQRALRIEPEPDFIVKSHHSQKLQNGALEIPLQNGNGIGRAIQEYHQMGLSHGRGLSYFTPRHLDLHRAATAVLADDPHHANQKNLHPVHALMHAVSGMEKVDNELEAVFELFEQRELDVNQVLWNAGDEALEIVVVGSGELVLVSEVENGVGRVVETLLPGTMIGELEMFSERPRTCRLQAAGRGQTVVWSMRRETFKIIEEENAQLANKFMRRSLAFDSERLVNVVQHARALWD